jgi:hypothetical protein
MIRNPKEIKECYKRYGVQIGIRQENESYDCVAMIKSE